MVSKNGILRIIEASISILIIASALIIINYKNINSNGIDLTNQANGLVEELSKNQTIRGAVLDYNINEKRNSTENEKILKILSNFSQNKIKNKKLGFSISICLPDKICPLEEEVYSQTNGDIFSVERLISTNLTEKDFNPKKIKVFMWVKK